MVEHLVDIRRRESKLRLGHFLLDLGARLKPVGLGSSQGYTRQLTQYLLADALGVSAVQGNRVVRDLREDAPSRPSADPGRQCGAGDS